MTETDGKSTTASLSFAAQMLPPLDRIAAVIEILEGGSAEGARADLRRMLALVDLFNALTNDLTAACAKAEPFERCCEQLARAVQFFAAANGGQLGPQHAPLVDLLGALVELGDGGQPALFDLPSHSTHQDAP